MTMNTEGKVIMNIKETDEQLCLLDQERQGKLEFPGVLCCCYECVKKTDPDLLDPE